MARVLKVGVVGYSRPDFDQELAKAKLADVLAILKLDFGVYEVVSGYTAVGIPGLAYQVAAEYGLVTVGFACAKASGYPCYPCDKVFLIGETWGDESEQFLAYIDVLLKFGGGEQSAREYGTFPGPKCEFDVSKPWTV